MSADRQANDNRHVAVIGGGVIGLATGWRLARAGLRVTVYDRGAAGRAASWVAGGMLAPIAEYGYEHEAFYELGTKSLARYLDFLDELANDTGTRVELDMRGTLSVGLDRDDTEALRREYNFRESRGLRVRWLTGSEARDIEPLLSPRVTAGMWIPDDFQVNNRHLVQTLADAIAARGGTIREHTSVRRVVVGGGRVRGVETEEGMDAADVVVVAAGCWSNQIDGIPAGAVPPVRPVKGQIVCLHQDDSVNLTRVIRTPDCYLVSKGDGRLLVGATEEDMGFDVSATAGPVMRLIERAWEAVPAIYDLAIESIDVGLRPGSRDHIPIIGATNVPGLVMATGHYRHGILLAPATADAVCDGIVTGEFAADMEAFSPARFVRA